MYNVAYGIGNLIVILYYILVVKTGIDATNEKTIQVLF